MQGRRWVQAVWGVLKLGSMRLRFSQCLWMIRAKTSKILLQIAKFSVFLLLIMTGNLNTLDNLLLRMPPITLEEMKSVRLMKRMDTKFVTNRRLLERLLELTTEQYFAQAAGDKRYAGYRTLYWDTPLTHEMFRQHHCGHFPRTKVRARTYLDSGHSFLEIKKKDNHGKTRKKRIAIPSIEAAVEQRMGEEFLQELTPYTFDTIVPTIENRFRRITLVNRDKTERLTIDFDLRFLNHETGQEHAMPDVVIIELKRDGRVPSPIMSMLRALRIKPSGFSKYCVGSAITNQSLRQNRFKKRLRRYEKIVSKN